jgi:hypothetical protein
MKVASLDKVTGPPGHRSPECGNPDEAWPEVPSPSEPAHVRNDFEDFLEDPGLAEFFGYGCRCDSRSPPWVSAGWVARPLFPAGSPSAAPPSCTSNRSKGHSRLISEGF